MRRVALIVGIVVVVLAGGLVVLSHSPAFDMWAFRKVAAYSLAQPQPQLAAPDEMSVLLVGTGSPLPDKTRGGPCTLVAVGDRLFIVDAGIDSARNLLLWRVPLEKVAAILVTHFHSDHIPELGELRLQTWVAGRKVPLPVYGPPGIETVVGGFNQAYALDAGYRTEHHGAAMLPPDAVAMVPKTVDIGSRTTTTTVLDSDGLKITAIRVHHEPATPAYGYRFDYHGRSIVISGDTAPDEDLARAAQGADILVHEGLSPEMVGIMGEEMLVAGHPRQAKIMRDIPGYHTAPVDAARIANEAHAKLLVFTHIIPMLPNALAERAFLRGVDDVRPYGVVLGRDGAVFKLPAGSDAIEQSSLE
jgi:ribonuclease Z